MTKRDDAAAATPLEGEPEVTAAAAGPGTDPEASAGRPARSPRARARTEVPPPSSEEESEDGPTEPPSDGGAPPRHGFVASGPTEWASLADSHAAAPGGTYSAGVIGHGADIGVLGTDNGTGAGVGVLGTVTNRANAQPAVYGFTQGSGPGVQGESDGAGPAVLGTDNGMGTGYGVMAALTNPENTRPAVYGSTAGPGAGVEGDSNGTGPGVFGFSEGTGPGVRGAGVGVSPGVEGQSSGTGPGVLALNDGSGPALEVQGPATFSRSGLAKVKAKDNDVTVSFPGVTPTSMVLATLQTVAKGIAVAAAVPDVDRFTIRLTKRPKVDVVVAWFVLGS